MWYSYTCLRDKDSCEDHKEASDSQNWEPDQESEPFRCASRISQPVQYTEACFSAALESAALKYLDSHYREGTVSTFATTGSPSRFTIQIVANKYNPNNYWYTL